MVTAKQKVTTNGIREVYDLTGTNNKVMYGQGVYFIADENGKPISNKYNKISQFENGIAVFQRGSKKGIIDAYGNEILKKLYTNVYIDNDIIRICQNGKWGFANITGKVICVPKYMFLERFINGYARICIKVENQELWGVIAKNGRVIIQPKYSYLGSLDRPEIVAKDVSGYGVIDIRGNIIVPLKYKKMHYDGKKIVIFNVNEEPIIL